jgi:hypothetical protein
MSAMTASEGRRQARSLVDAKGRSTDDLREAVRGEFVEYDARSKRTRRTWFSVEQVEIKWLPVSESAFLLWVLVLLVAVWLATGVALGLI